MTQKKLNAELQRLLDTGIKFHEAEISDYEMVQTVVIVGDLEFEIARRKINRQTLTEGSDFSLLLDEKATLQNDAWLLCSKLNFIYERQSKC